MLDTLIEQITALHHRALEAERLLAACKQDCEHNAEVRMQQEKRITELTQRAEANEQRRLIG